MENYKKPIQKTPAKKVFSAVFFAIRSFMSHETKQNYSAFVPFHVLKTIDQK